MLDRTPKHATYLNAAELGITEKEREALIAVRDDLASGRVKHEPNVGSFPADPVFDIDAKLFSMRDYVGYSRYGCGTCHCIGGFMMARGVCLDLDYSPNLLHLFVPEVMIINTMLRNLTVEQAVAACDHFLVGADKKCWKRALEDVPLEGNFL